jgi:hypothetical protein
MITFFSKGSLMNKKPIFEEIFTKTEILEARSAEVAETTRTRKLPFESTGTHWHFDQAHGRRLGRLRLQTELLIRSPSGDIVELGSGPGHNLAHFMWTLKEIRRKGVTIYGFDTFEGYLEEHMEKEGSLLASSLRENQKNNRWTACKETLQSKLNSLDNTSEVELIKGDICETTKNFVPKSGMISVVNIDTNVYKPALEGLLNLEKYFIKNTLLIVDSGFLSPGDPLQGEHRALYEYATKRNYPIFKSNWGDYCSFIAVVH